MSYVTKWPIARPISMNAFYGNPDANQDGQPDAMWEAKNLTYIVPAYDMVWSWNLQKIKKIRVHQLVAPSLDRILKQIAKLDTDMIKRCQLDHCGGAYNFRTMRGGNKLSMHSWGSAIDLAPAINWLGRKYAPTRDMMPQKVVEIFEDEGWEWGGLWQRPDAMHFQACKTV